MSAQTPAEPEPTVPAEDRRLSFGARADDYDRFRPTYPQTALEWALGRRPLRVADLGAGTGLMSRVLAGAGHDVLAVEPDAGMRRHVAALGSGPGPGTVRAVEGSAESIPVADGSLDALVAAQSFHWFDLPVALPEMQRSLRAGGVLVIVWNQRDDDVDWVEELSSIVGRYDARSGNRDAGVPGIEPWFVDVGRRTFRHTQRLDVDGLLGLVGTFSYVALAPDRDQILDQVRALAQNHPALAGRATIGLPYQTVVYRARRPPTDQ